MHILKIENGQMKMRAQKGAFTLYTHLSWTGRLVLGNAGARYDTDALALCPELDTGSVSMILDEESETVVRAQADHGSHDHLQPDPGQRLLLVSARPMTFTPKTLEAIASATIGGDEVLDLPEVQSANARHFIARLYDMGVGNPPEHIL